MKKVLITDKVHQLLIEGLEQKGWEVTYDTSITLATLPQYIGALDGIIINSKIVMDRTMIDLGSKLRFIARLGSGMEIIDRSYAEQRGILVANSPEGNRDAVAEHAVAMLLMLANKLGSANQEVKNMLWRREDHRGWELKGKTIGIIGFGHTGSSLAKKLSSWDMRIIYHDKYPDNLSANAADYEYVSLQDICNQSDIISLHLPLTTETKHLVDDAFVDSCKDGVLLINTSRGQVVNTESLIKGLACSKLKGACIDVFENEKPESYTNEEKQMYSELFSFDNIIVSPHVAGWTNESLERIAKVTLEKISSVLI